MPTPESFALELQELANALPGHVNETVRRVAVAVNQTITLATPVDTGRARANWQVSLGAPELAQRNETDKGGGATIARNRSVIDGFQGGKIYLSNNVPYIGRLNEGWSAQAPAGFVEKAIQSGVRAADRGKLV